MRLGLPLIVGVNEPLLRSCICIWLFRAAVRVIEFPLKAEGLGRLVAGMSVLLSSLFFA